MLINAGELEGGVIVFGYMVTQAGKCLPHDSGGQSEPSLNNWCVLTK